MLLSFRVANHKSIYGEQTLHMQPVYDKSRSALPVAAIFGANAAGKSNVLDALKFMVHAVRDSFSQWAPRGGVPRQPFRLDREADAEPSLFAVELLLNDVRYVYGFSVDRLRVTREWLHSYPYQRRRVVFERDGDRVRIGAGGSRQRSRAELIEALTPENVLFLDVAGRSGFDEVEAVHQWFSDQVIFASPSSFDIDEAALVKEIADGRYGDKLIGLVRAADLGISNMEAGWALKVDGGEFLIDRDVARSMGEKPEEFKIWDFSGKPVPSQTESRLVFRHVGEGVSFALSDESRGTQIWLCYLLPVLRCLNGGLLLVIDEIDSSLHPYLTAQLVRMFRDPEINERRAAQLIFTTHDATLLGKSFGEEILSRDEVWFVEKNQKQATELFSLADFKPRQDDNIQRRYLTGAYGAIPQPAELRFGDTVRGRSA